MRAVSPLLRLIGIVIAGVACGLFAAACSDQPAALADYNCASTAEGGKGGGGGFGPRGDSWTSPLIQSLAVFQGERRAVDRLPQDDCTVIDTLESARDAALSPSPPGRPLVGKSRLALDGLPRRRRLFVLPTTRGGVCGIVTEPVGNSFCGNGSNSPGYGYWNPDRGNPYIWGVLPNEIVAIDIRTGNRTSRVPVRRNAFYFQFGREVRFSSLRLAVRYRDGSKQAIWPFDE